MGKPGKSTRVGEEWAGWSGHVAHPRAPLGSGGPGDFAPTAPLKAADADLPSHLEPGPLDASAMNDSEVPQPPNKPPETNPRSLGNQVGPIRNSLMDVLIDAKVLEDGTSGEGTHTEFNEIPLTAPGYDTDSAGKITKFKGLFVWKGTIRIQTLYGSGEEPSTVSCYGRGTTEEDIKKRDITLGFHEHCHREDYVGYLATNSLPEPPELEIGMSAKDYEDQVKKFKKGVTDYWASMKKQTIATTDEVGHKKSVALKTGKCYDHLLP